VLRPPNALAEAHALGIVHRDLKPQEPVPGAARRRTTVVKVRTSVSPRFNELDEATPKLTETRSLIGSPHYMSPEQLRSAHDVDSRADIWSMGVVSTSSSPRRPPFDGHTLGAVFAKVLESSPKSVRVLRPDVPPPVEAAITRCLERDPARRFQHIGELALALAHLDVRSRVYRLRILNACNARTLRLALRGSASARIPFIVSATTAVSCRHAACRTGFCRGG